ncbi:MAG: hypothetical protein NUW22_03645, partial [Acidobacteria bacterium]|nr:hypothetical protein [Acidobacteriota bacterium]
MRVSIRVVGALVVGLAVFSVQFQAQDRLAKMPGVEQFRKMQTALAGGAFVSAAITPIWAPDAKSFTYTHAGSRFTFDVTTMAAVNEGPAPAGAAGGRGGRGGRAGGPPAGGRGGRGAGVPGLGGCPPAQVERGRQAACVGAPDGSKRAFHKDRN